MVGSTTTLISVRGEARLVVPPDSAILSGGLRATRDTKAEALQTTSVELKRLTADLGALGGVPLTVEARKRPLVWAAYSAGTQLEHDQDQQTGRYGPTGRVIASVSVALTVRAFDLLDRLGSALATHETFDVHEVVWEVDSDNASWSQVRDAAIQNAITKGRQYAHALGGSLDHLEHLADAGLLDGGEGGPTRESRRAPLSDAGPVDTPSLDPVPQELIAVVDARFAAAVGGL